MEAAWADQPVILWIKVKRERKVNRTRCGMKKDSKSSIRMFTRETTPQLRILRGKEKAPVSRRSEQVLSAYAFSICFCPYSSENIDFVSCTKRIQTTGTLENCYDWMLLKSSLSVQAFFENRKHVMKNWIENRKAFDTTRRLEIWFTVFSGPRQEWVENNSSSRFIGHNIRCTLQV